MNMPQPTYLFLQRPPFLKGSFSWKGRGYQYAEPVPPEVLRESEAAGRDPWIALAAACEAAKDGRRSCIRHLRRWVRDEQVAPTLAAACLDLIADAGGRDDLEFLAGLMLDGSDAQRISACQVAQWCGVLWLVPFMLEARKSVRRITDKRTIESNLSNLLEDIDGDLLLYGGSYSDDQYFQLVNERMLELASQGGSEDVVVFSGQLFDMEQQIWRMKHALLERSSSHWVDWGRFLLWRRKFEPFTGADCSSFYSTSGDFQPLNAVLVLDRYTEVHAAARFGIGKRYFFGRAIDLA